MSTESLTPEQITELEAIEATMTEGEWGEDGIAIVRVNPASLSDHLIVDRGMKDANRHGIVLLRNHARALIAAAWKQFQHEDMMRRSQQAIAEGRVKTAKECREELHHDIIAENTKLREENARIKAPGMDSGSLKGMKVEYHADDNRFYAYDAKGKFLWSGSATYNIWRCVQLSDDLDRERKAWAAEAEAIRARNREYTAENTKLKAELEASDNYRRYTELIEENAKLRAERAWRPIATAITKERIRVIGAYADLVVGDIFFGPASLLIAKMGDPEYVNERSEVAWRYTQTENKLLSHQQPTHWRPLPETPATVAMKGPAPLSNNRVASGHIRPDTSDEF